MTRTPPTETARLRAWLEELEPRVDALEDERGTRRHRARLAGRAALAAAWTLCAAVAFAAAVAAIATAVQ